MKRLGGALVSPFPHPAVSGAAGGGGRAGILAPERRCSPEDKQVAEKGGAHCMGACGG